MLGGPVMNLLIAVVLLGVILMGIGVPGPNATTTVAVVGQCVTTDFAAECGDGDQPTPAAAAGLQAGDTIVSYGGRPTATWTDVQAAIREVPGGDIPVVVEREGVEVTLVVSPVTTNRPVFDDDGQVVVGADGEPVLAPTRYIGFSPTAEVERQPASVGCGR